MKTANKICNTFYHRQQFHAISCDFMRFRVNVDTETHGEHTQFSSSSQTEIQTKTIYIKHEAIAYMRSTLFFVFFCARILSFWDGMPIMLFRVFLFAEDNLMRKSLWYLFSAYKLHNLRGMCGEQAKLWTMVSCERALHTFSTICTYTTDNRNSWTDEKLLKAARPVWRKTWFAAI